MDSETVLEIKDLWFRYSTSSSYALKNINFKLRRGEICLLVGPTGCGKSTLCLTLLGIIPNVINGEFRGRVLIEGEDVIKNPIYKNAQKIGLVFQNPDNQLCCLTVEDEVAFGPENLGLPVKEILERVNSALSVMRIAELRDRYVFHLSEGEKQKVAIASVLSLKPEVLVLDEPLSHLDVKSVDKVLKEISRLRDEGFTILLVEHKLKSAIKIADRVVAMEHGEIVFEGDVKEALKSEIDRRLGLRTTIKAFREKKHEKSPKYAIVVENLSYEYNGGVKALREVSVRIPKDSTTVIVGCNGAGKTTLAMCIAGLLKPKQGRIFTDNLRIGLVLQNPDLMLVCDTVWEEVCFGARNLGEQEDKLNKRVEWILKKLGLYDKKDLHPHSLSRGQRLRLAVASVVSMLPDILILDEPTMGQDLRSLSLLFGFLEELRRKGMTIVFITHDLDVALAFSDWMIVMDRGKIVEQGPTEKVAKKEIFKRAGLVIQG